MAKDALTAALVLREIDGLIAKLAETRDWRDKLNRAAVRDTGAEDAFLKCRRMLATEAIAHLISFVNSAAMLTWEPGIARDYLDQPLEELWDALQDLQGGARPKLFSLPSPAEGRRNKVAKPSEETFRGRAAGIVQVLSLAGDDVDDAANTVAKALTDFGYEKLRIVGEDPSARV